MSCDFELKMIVSYINRRLMYAEANRKQKVSKQRKLNRKFRNHFKTRKAPAHNTILRLTEQFLRQGDLSNLSAKASGRKKTARTPHKISKVKQLITENPKKSSQRLAQEAATSKTTLLRILKKDLKLKPYKTVTCQKLSKQNKAERQSFASWFLKKSAENQNFIHSIWFSDEAHFHLDGTVNSQNNRIWSDTKPETAKEKPLHSSKVTAWCALSSQGVIGPLWFQDSNKKTATVNQERYQAVLEQFWRRANNKHGEDMKHMWFQQDGAPPHTARKTKQWLGEHFGDRVISRGAGDAWPANSPDLTPLDFFSLGSSQRSGLQRGSEDLGRTEVGGGTSCACHPDGHVPPGGGVVQDAGQDVLVSRWRALRKRAVNGVLSA